MHMNELTLILQLQKPDDSPTKIN